MSKPDPEQGHITRKIFHTLENMDNLINQANDKVKQLPKIQELGQPNLDNDPNNPKKK